ncbi:major facilitator superfamily domain-containing protein [Corynascus novoguineensis]|uniref:Major facilitator superfamily domain-containing protein n=1 Tax=Corynascus novoguineensis TaxID=1126955 RepID=A0AAN7CWA9_9PEZI|nr:major facilitator superfamily domain-containing protein [Corynascus novoguineensis]
MSDEKPPPNLEDGELAPPQADSSQNGTPQDSDGPTARPSYTAKQEARVVRKLDLNLMTLFFALYMLAFLDRGNIGNARIAGMANDLGLDTNRYNWLLNMFYISYVIAEFSVLLWKIFPPHIVGAIVVFSWGLIATVQAGVQSWGGEMALRFLLGAFEAAYGPGIIYLLSFFYLRHEIGFRCGIFASAAPLASTFAGALAYGITSGHPKLASWRLLFLVEGLPTVLMTVIAFFFIPDSPDRARFLTADEKAIVRSRTVRQVGSAAASERIGGVRLRDVAAIFLDLKAWLCALMYFCGNVSYSSLPVFLPTILEDMGYTAINAQGLSAPPSFAAFLFALVTTWIADRTQQRCFVLFTTSAIGGVGYIILATVETVGVRYFATFLASAGVFSTIPNILALTLNNQGNDTRRGMSIVLINLVGQCGPFLGTNVFPLEERPRYVKGMSICASFMFFSALIALAQRGLLMWENRQLDRKYGPVVIRKLEKKEDGGEGGASPNNEPEGAVAIENYGPNFRYVL